MTESQQKLQKFSRVVFVFAKIGFVCCIVGLCLCGFALVWAAVFGSPMANTAFFLSPVDAKGRNLAECYGDLAYVLTYCATLLVVMHLLMRLFANMRDHYTPFTMENATLLKRIAIRMILASLLPAIVGQAVGNGCAKMLSLPFKAEYGDNLSLIVVLIFFALSMVFQYGCALQEQADTTL